MVHVCFIALCALIVYKRYTTVHKKCVPLGTQKLFRKSLPLLIVSTVPKDFQQTPNGNTAVKFKGILHAGRVQNEI